MMSLADYGSYMREVDIDWNHIWWVTVSIDELVGDGVLSKEEAQNLVDSLYYGERYKEFNEGCEL